MTTELSIGTVRETDRPAHLEATRLNRHTFWCGQSGSGKTYALGVLLEQVLLHTALPIIVLDPNADFVRMSEVRPDAPADTIEMLAVTGEGAWIVQTPRLAMKANGSGDVTAALFTAHLLESGDPAVALGRTASSVFDLLQTTLDSGERELQLVQSQQAIADPRMQFEVTRLH